MNDNNQNMSINGNQSPDVLVNNKSNYLLSLESKSRVMEDKANQSRNNDYNYGAINEWTLKRNKNNEIIVDVMQNTNSLTNTMNNNSNQTNDRVNESPILVTNGSNASHSRLGLPFSNRYKPSDDVIIDLLFKLFTD